MANKRPYVPESEFGSDFSVPVPKVDQLASQFYTRGGLHKHLMSMSPAMLSKILLSQVQDHQFRPKPQIPGSAPKSRIKNSPCAHCVYCHKMYDKLQNQGCKVDHFGELEDANEFGDKKEWTCCRGEVSYVDYDPDYHVDPIDEEPYCYTGPHWEREIRDDDGQEDDWWKVWGDSEMTCADTGCDKGLERLMKVGMSAEKRARR